MVAAAPQNYDHYRHRVTMRLKPVFFSLLAILAAAGLFAQQQRREPPAQYPARGTRGAVAAGSGYATDAGMRMYYTGGNAVDAGVATIFAAATTEYSHVGWG